MPRLRIIVLDQVVPGTWSYVLWANVTSTARQPFYTTTGVSQWKGALPVDNIAIQTGQVVEQRGVINTPGFTVPQLQTELQSRWSDFQTFVNSSGLDANPWTRYGSNWDGVTWTSTGVT